jgi:hypothetical protein
MYGTKTKSKVKKTRGPKVSARRKRIAEKKSSSPGVPPNTCPYIDLVITMIKDISEAYDKLYTKGEHNPMVVKLEEQACEMLDSYIRSSNETLRDNSAYWYIEYKRKA